MSKYSFYYNPEDGEHYAVFKNKKMMVVKYDDTRFYCEEIENDRLLDLEPVDEERARLLDPFLFSAYIDLLLEKRARWYEYRILLRERPKLLDFFEVVFDPVTGEEVKGELWLIVNGFDYFYFLRDKQKRCFRVLVEGQTFFLLHKGKRVRIYVYDETVFDTYAIV